MCNGTLQEVFCRRAPFVPQPENIKILEVSYESSIVYLLYNVSVFILSCNDYFLIFMEMLKEKKEKKGNGRENVAYMRYNDTSKPNI